MTEDDQPKAKLPRDAEYAKLELLRIEPGIRESRGYYDREARGKPNFEMQAGDGILQSIGIISSFNPERLASADYRATTLAAAAILNPESSAGLKVDEAIASSNTYAYYRKRLSQDETLKQGLLTIAQHIYAANVQHGDQAADVIENAQQILDDMKLQAAARGR